MAGGGSSGDRRPPLVVRPHRYTADGDEFRRLFSTRTRSQVRRAACAAAFQTRFVAVVGLCLVAVPFVAPSGRQQRWLLAALTGCVVAAAAALYRCWAAMLLRYMRTHASDLSDVAAAYVQQSDGAVWLVFDPVAPAGDPKHPHPPKMLAAAAASPASAVAARGATPDAACGWVQRWLDAFASADSCKAGQYLLVRRVVVTPRRHNPRRGPRPPPNGRGTPGALLFDALESTARGLGFDRVKVTVPSLDRHVLNVLTARGYVVDSLQDVRVARGFWHMEVYLMSLDLRDAAHVSPT